MKPNKKYKKEVKINIKDYFKEINDKRELIKDFKNKYINTKKYNINKNKCEIVTLRINSLNKLLNEFERVISMSLDIISSLQNNIAKNENIKIKIKKIKEIKEINEKKNNNEPKENKENIFKKINEPREKNNSSNNYYHFLNNNKTSESLNSELIKKNKRLLFNKSYTLEANKNNSSHNNNIINVNNELKVSTNNNINNNNNSNNSNNNNNFNISLQTDFNSYSNNLSIISPINNIKNNNANNSNSQSVINYSNITKYPQNYIRNNFPLLKERTLTTLYNPDYSKYFSMQKSQNIIDLNNNKNLPFSQVDLFNHNCNNYTFEQKDDKYSQKTLEIKSKSPLRKAIRTLIHENKLSQRTYDYSNKVNKDDILNKIKESEKCKKYFSEKYGEGSYYTFLNKYKIGKLDKMQIKKEFKIISNILESYENENSTNHYKKRNSAINKSNLDDIRNILSDSREQIGIRKRYFFKKFNSDSNRNKSRNSQNENINDKIHRKLKYSKIEELIKSFEEIIKQ